MRHKTGLRPHVKQTVASRQFVKGAQRGDPVVFVSLGGVGIRDTGKALASVMPFADQYGYTYVRSHTSSALFGSASLLTAEFAK